MNGKQITSPTSLVSMQCTQVFSSTNVAVSQAGKGAEQFDRPRGQKLLDLRLAKQPSGRLLSAI